MKNKSILIAILIMALAIVIGFSVEHITNLSANERLESMFSFNTSIKSLRTDLEGSMQFNYPDEIKELAPMLSQESQVKGYCEAIYDPNNFQMLAKESIDISGITLEMSTFFNHDEVFIKYPIIGKPLYISLSDINELSGVEFPQEWLSKLYKIMININQATTKSLIQNINPEHITYGNNIIFEQNGYSQTLKTINIELSSDDIINIVKVLFSDIINDADLNKFINEAIEHYSLENDNLLNAKDKISDFKDNTNKILNEDFDSKEYQEFYDLIQEMLNNSNIKITIGFSNLNIPLYVKFDFDIAIIDQDSDMKFNVKYNIEQKLSKFNSIESIDSSEFNKDNCLPLIDFIKSN